MCGWKNICRIRGDLKIKINEEQCFHTIEGVNMDENFTMNNSEKRMRKATVYSM